MPRTCALGYVGTAGIAGFGAKPPNGIAGGGGAIPAAGIAPGGAKPGHPVPKGAADCEVAAAGNGIAGALVAQPGGFAGAFAAAAGIGGSGFAAAVDDTVVGCEAAGDSGEVSCFGFAPRIGGKGFSDGPGGNGSLATTAAGCFAGACLPGGSRFMPGRASSSLPPASESFATLEPDVGEAAPRTNDDVRFVAGADDSFPRNCSS